MTLETPSSLGNDDRAALMIQAAYRRHQARADAGRRAKTTALETLEEHEEAMINKRQTLVRRMNEKLGGGLRGKLTRGLARMRIARALGGKGREDATEEEEEEEAPPLPSLGASALEDIIDSLKRGNVFSLIDAMAILQAATVRFAEEESVNYVNAEPGGSVVVVGDLHGQLHDLLFVLKERGMPSDKVKYVFNGDLVDRGNHGCEIALLLCALKLASPRCVFINRGNHEEAFINIYSGFEEECLQKYDHKVFQMFQSCFDWLPYACVVNESVFVIHGGPPCDEGATVDEVRTLPRGAESARAPVDKKRMQWYKELVWSDPHPEATFIGSVPSHRGAGVLWGKDVSERFLQTNKLEVIIRSHQCVGGGVETCHGGKVFTVFSASRYCGTGENKGAILSFMHGDKTPQPQNALVWSIPSGTGLLGYERIKSERKGKEAVNDAVAQQASEYIIEYKADLYRHWSAVSAKRREPFALNQPVRVGGRAVQGAEDQNIMVQGVRQARENGTRRNDERQTLCKVERVSGRVHRQAQGWLQGVARPRRFAHYVGGIAIRKRFVDGVRRDGCGQKRRHQPKRIQHRVATEHTVARDSLGRATRRGMERV